MHHDEDYLEGLRESDKQDALSPLWEKGDLDGWDATRSNWMGITPRIEDPYAKNYRSTKSEIPTIPNEGDFIHELSSRALYPIHPDGHNVSKQLADSVDKLSAISARRPPKDYHVKVVDNSNLAIATLMHTPTNEVVGQVKWFPQKSGHVDWLGVDEGHRHMTNYLITQAWNHSRAKGEVGPAAARTLSPFSEKIMRNLNPSAEEYQQHLADRKALEEPSAVTRECGTCNGDGTVAIHPHSADHGETVFYRDQHGNRIGSLLRVENNHEGRVLSRSNIRTAIGDSEVGYGREIRNERTGESFLWPRHNIECPSCGGSGRRQSGR